MAASGGGRSIADVLFSAFLDDSGLSQQAKEAGDKAGVSMSAGLQSALKKGLFLGFSAAAGIATKGLIELNQVQAEFQAETGATAEEAAAAGKAINEMAGRNLQPMQEIGKALTKVHTDLGLTGEAAVKTTEQFLKFAEATGQNASDAVLAFDDIMDNWGLTADHAQEIMDKLIVSHQRYGGTISDNERTLAKLAPAMKAANFQIDDGIALLGLFGAKGLDSERAAAAFSKALTKVKSPEELQKLIDDISATEDPFERAQKAAALFGAKAGAQLSNALGGVDFRSYQIGVEESAGATQHAADVLENTFGAQVQLRIKAVTAAITGFGQSFGPALTGLASLASLGGALGLDKVVSNAFGALTGSRLVKAAIAKAGSAAATAYLAALITGDQISAALSSAWQRVSATAGGRAAGAAFEKVGSALGTTAGKAFSLAFAAAAVIGLAITYTDIINQIKKQGEGLGQQAKQFAITATKEQLRGARDAIQQEASQQFRDAGALLAVPLIGGLLAGVKKEAGDQAQNVADTLTRAIDRDIKDTVAEKVSVSINEGMVKAAQDAAANRPQFSFFHDSDFDITKQVAASKERNRQAVATLAGDLATSLAQGGGNLKTVSAALAAQLPDAIKNNKDEVRRQAVLSMVQFAAGLRDKRAQIQAAIDQIGTDMENALSSRQERLLLQGQLAGKNITQGLKSTDPVVKAQAQGTVQLISDRLAELGVDASKLGGQAGKNYANALGDTKPIVASEAAKAASGATTTWDTYAEKANTWGYKTGAAYAAGLRKSVGLVNDAANFVAKNATGAFKASSPPGPESPLHKIDVWGQKTIEAYAVGLKAGIAAVRGAAGSVAGAVAAGLTGPSYSLAGAVSVPGGAMPLPNVRSLSSDVVQPRVVQQNNVTVQGLVRARDPFEISTAMERFQRTGVFEWPEEPK